VGVMLWEVMSVVLAADYVCLSVRRDEAYYSLEECPQILCDTPAFKVNQHLRSTK
jgi:hypothetical protein